jgi:hypothetical protein
MPKFPDLAAGRDQGAAELVMGLLKVADTFF